MRAVDPFVERAYRHDYLNPKPAKKPSRLVALVKGFANPHDIAHTALCLSFCTATHFLLEWVI